jgi:methyl-accepting chemotaxis protein
MDHVTQQNAAMVEESTAASSSLTQQGEKLSRRVACFKLRGEASLNDRHTP